MNETMFKIVELAVSLDYVVFTFSVSLVIAVGMGYFLGSIRDSVRFGIISSVIFEILMIILFYGVRDKVAKERLNLINETMAVVTTVAEECSGEGVIIRNWREGLSIIATCPKEVGYYVRTADLLEEERDYNAAATLIEYGLDFIEADAVPPPLCERLIRYYEHLVGRPRLDVECNKYYDL